MVGFFLGLADFDDLLLFVAMVEDIFPIISHISRAKESRHVRFPFEI
jgi:hypothetical protein